MTPYPGVASLAIEDATSSAVDLAALAQGYALFFGMTDPRNVAVGQQIGCQIGFSAAAHGFAPSCVCVAEAGNLVAWAV